jgi:hypothetical protein
VPDRTPELPRRELVACVAVRPAVEGTSGVFTALRRPRYAEPQPDQLAHMGLAPEDLDAALEPDAFDAAWADFVRPRDVLLGWTQLTLDLLPLVPSSMALKGVYRSVAGVPSGHLCDVVRRHGLTPPAPVFPGRAGERLADSVAVVEHLRDLALAWLGADPPPHSSLASKEPPR